MSSVARKIFSTRPNPSTTPAAARAIVSTLRDAGPMPWKELWTASAGAERVVPREEELAAQRAMKKREDGHLRVSELGYVPEGHPFQSVTYFKHHILKNLEHQGFIEKVSISHAPVAPSDAPSSSGSASSTLAAVRRESVLQKQARKSLRAQEKAPASGSVGTASAADASKTVQEFVWALPHALTARPAELDADPLLAAERARLENRLERLYAARHNHDLVAIARDQRAHEAGLAADGRERAIRSGRVQRTQDEVMAWPFRKDYLTTEKERDYLNKRRGLARPAKERRAQSWLEAAEARHEEARQ